MTNSEKTEDAKRDENRFKKLHLRDIYMSQDGNKTMSCRNNGRECTGALETQAGFPGQIFKKNPKRDETRRDETRQHNLSESFIRRLILSGKIFVSTPTIHFREVKRLIKANVSLL